MNEGGEPIEIEIHSFCGTVAEALRQTRPFAGTDVSSC